MDEHVVPVNTPRQWGRLLVGLAVLLALDAYFIGAAVTTDATKTRVGGIVFAALVTALALFVAVGCPGGGGGSPLCACSSSCATCPGRARWRRRVRGLL